MDEKSKKSFFDFLKNPNVKKLEKMGKTRHGADKDKKKYKEGGVVKKEENTFEKIMAALKNPNVKKAEKAGYYRYGERGNLTDKDKKKK